MGLMIDSKEAERRIKKLENNFNNSEDLLKAVGNQLNKNIKGLFNSKKNPFGVRWIPSKSNPDTLVDSGDLRDSGLVKVSGDKVVISYGNGLDYARFHNDGINQIKRQFVPNKGKLPKDWRKQTEGILRKGLFGDIR